MNAYELADRIIKPDCFREYIIDAVMMLRQQADRIAELEKQLKTQADMEFEADRAYWKYKKLDTSAEPVAWVDAEKLKKLQKFKYVADYWEAVTGVEEEYSIPLYITPQATRLDNVLPLSETSDISIDKPVAWVDFSIEGVPVQLDYEWGCQMQKSGVRVPLYTTPQTKPLEIEKEHGIK